MLNMYDAWFAVDWTTPSVYPISEPQYKYQCWVWRNRFLHFTCLRQHMEEWQAKLARREIQYIEPSRTTSVHLPTRVKFWNTACITLNAAHLLVILSTPQGWTSIHHILYVALFTVIIASYYCAVQLLKFVQCYTYIHVYSNAIIVPRMRLTCSAAARGGCVNKKQSRINDEESCVGALKPN